MTEKKWEVISKLKTKNILETLLKNRGLNSKKARQDFLKPKDPQIIKLSDLKISVKEIAKAIQRLKIALKNKEGVIVYGDYDCDGVTATAILWETLYKLGFKVMPFIPNRFSEGYGLNAESIQRLKEENPDLKLIITVDNGIVANKAVKIANKLGIDVIITDHHEKGKSNPKALSIIHTIQIGGAAVAWFFAREVKKAFKLKGALDNLELAAIGTISDQLSLLGPNRSIVKFGLELLRKTKRMGLNSLIEVSGIEKAKISVYEVAFLIAPRINSVGRLTTALDSLRLLCTRDKKRANELANLLNKTNLERQKIVGEVLIHAREKVDLEAKEIIVLAHETYHEGVIGLAASKLVEEFYRPAIVISKKGRLAKASARSINGINIIETLRKLDFMWLEGGGHAMAAGFSLKTSKIEEFRLALNKLAKPFLTDEVLKRKLKIDCEISLAEVNENLLKDLLLFEPSGFGNPTPTFVSKKVRVLEAKTVGSDKKHLKLKLGEKGLGAIGFGLGHFYERIDKETSLDIVYSIEENNWNHKKSLQLKIKDVQL